MSVKPGRYTGTSTPVDATHMSKTSALTARCDYAMFKILGAERSADRANALHLATQCGYKAYPCTEVSAFFVNEAELLAAHLEGWKKHEYDDRPLTESDLAATIAKKDKSALQGCGQFYELYEQAFNNAITPWLRSLRERERKVALELLKTTAYSPEERGTWTYDVEENDVTYSPGTDEE